MDSGTEFRAGCLPESDLAMSYILDALKKIEHEKNKRTRPDGRISISGDLFQERKHPAAKAGIWKILILIALASLVTCVGTWFVLQRDSTKSGTVQRSSVPQPPVPVTPSVVPPAIPVPVQSQVPVTVVPTVAPPAVAPDAVKSPEALAGADSSVQKARRPIKQTKAQSPSPILPAQTVPPPADIKLSGIAWQDEHASRRAVVNGFLLKEGAVVAGAKIVDIQADRVRFSSSAGLFEIKLDAVLPAGAQR